MVTYIINALGPRKREYKRESTAKKEHMSDRKQAMNNGRKSEKERPHKIDAYRQKFSCIHLHIFSIALSDSVFVSSSVFLQFSFYCSFRFCFFFLFFIICISYLIYSTIWLWYSIYLSCYCVYLTQMNDHSLA